MDHPFSLRRQRYYLMQPSTLPDGKSAPSLPPHHPNAMPGLPPQETARLHKPLTYTQIEARLLPRYDSLRDLEAAASRLADAVMRNEKVGISGDYDCDGNCSTALMIRFLAESGLPPGHIEVHIPNRKEEGYGINRDAVGAMKGKDVGLLFTLDNGTLAHGPLAHARAEGMDVVVVDHHPNSADQPLPKEALVVNPKRADEPLRTDPYGAPDLAAVGVSWLVCRRATQILAERGYYTRQGITPPDPQRWLGLVAVATQADVVNIQSPLNRQLLMAGLRVIQRGEDPYITSLARVAGVPDVRQLNEEDISFKLAPMINAPGRLNQSVAWAFLSPISATTTPVAALLADAQDQTTSLYTYLRKHRAPRLPINREAERALQEARTTPPPPAEMTAPTELVIHPMQYALMVTSKKLNDLRKTVEHMVLREARPLADRWIKDHPESGTLLLAGEDWHEGVIGIVAGKLKEQLTMPVIVASINPETGLCKASARSIKTPDDRVDIGQCFRDLCEKEMLMLKAGGHPMAAGASFEARHIPALRQRVEEMLGEASQHARATIHQPVTGLVEVAAAAPGSNMSYQAQLHQWLQTQKTWGPFGEGTPKPLIGLHGMAIRHLHRSRDGRHVYFDLCPPARFSDTPPIRGAAFHAAGTPLEDAIRRAASPQQSMPGAPLQLPVFLGTIEQDADTKAAPGALRFLLNDVLELTTQPGEKTATLQAAFHTTDDVQGMLSLAPNTTARSHR